MKRPRPSTRIEGARVLAALMLIVAIASWSRGDTIYLAANTSTKNFFIRGLLTQEILRQAVLIAARDEMGMQTRDASLREWRGDPPRANTLELAFIDNQAVLRNLSTPAKVYWQKSYYDKVDYEAGRLTNYGAFVEQAEKFSREDFSQALQTGPWTFKANSIVETGAAPDDAEKLLAEMEELSQFAAAREAHAAIAAQGESPARVGVLVRAYANLGQLTRYHWSAEYAVYQARSLLYAQRMVAAHPNSAVALWHRAYARAMAGFETDAIKDLKSAEKLNDPNPPPWVALIEPLCKYQTGKLVKLSEGDETIAGLAMFQAFLTVEQSHDHGVTISIARSALDRNPRCLRLVDAMCAESESGLPTDLSQRGPQIFSQTLGDQLEKTPGLPQTVIDRIHELKQPGGNPNGREEICQRLIDLGAPDSDKGEPSWSALGRLIQETDFARDVQTVANMMAVQWGADASDYVRQFMPQVEDHPYKFMIQACGQLRGQDFKALDDLFINEPREADIVGNIEMMPVLDFLQYIRLKGTDVNNRIWYRFYQNFDCNSMELEKMLYAYRNGGDASSAQNLEDLQRVSGDSPTVVEDQITHHWDPQKARTWEADLGDYAAVAKALALQYAANHQWDDAERNARRYSSVSPDLSACELLAQIYDDQGQHDKWRQTLLAFKSTGTDYELEESQAQREVAEDYMKNGDFKSAIPYADQAAKSQDDAAIISDVRAHQGIGDWTGAQQLLAGEIQLYSGNPVSLYLWCVHTGHGDAAAAYQQLLDYCKTNDKYLNYSDLMYLGCAQQSMKKLDDAIATFERRYARNPGPVSAIEIAILADANNDSQKRDKMIKAVVQSPVMDQGYTDLAAMFQAAFQAGPDAPLDAEALDKILAHELMANRVTMCAMVATYFETRGKKDQALIYLKKGAVGLTYRDGENRPVIDVDLREMGIDPLSLDTAPATEPSN